MRIALKNCVWERQGDALIVLCDPSKQIELGDPDGHAEALLTALAKGPQTLPELREQLAESGIEVAHSELQDAISALDSIRLLEDADATGPGALGPAGRDGRYFSNLAYFDLVATLDTSGAELQRRLTSAHVLQLGTGGLGSNVLQNLAGLGVGRLTLLDRDIVEPRNFARQFLYRNKDIGGPKVRRAAEWIREFDPSIEVGFVERDVTSAADVADLLGGVDLVVGGIDQPDQVDFWVNEACVRAGVPWIRGGMIGTELLYYSVDPGRSPCLACWWTAIDAEAKGSGTDALATRLSAKLSRVNRGIGPAASLIGSLVAWEALRYLARYEPPQSAGVRVHLETTGDCAVRREPWPADPDCALCRTAGARLSVPS